MSTIVSKTYIEDGEGPVDTLLEVETNDYDEVDLVVNPRTVEAQSFTFSTEEAWRLSRELAKAAAGVEISREARMPAP